VEKLRREMPRIEECEPETEYDFNGYEEAPLDPEDDWKLPWLFIAMQFLDDSLLPWRLSIASKILNLYTNSKKLWHN